MADICEHIDFECQNKLTVHNHEFMQLGQQETDLYEFCKSLPMRVLQEDMNRYRRHYPRLCKRHLRFEPRTFIRSRNEQHACHEPYRHIARIIVDEINRRNNIAEQNPIHTSDQYYYYIV